MRHQPDSIGLSLDKNGWACVTELIEKANRHGKKLDKELINQIIRHGSKKRFVMDDEGKFIRAGYGHSIEIDLELKPKTPPPLLYYGTANTSVEAIRKEGIKAVGRNFVHLSVCKEDAQYVGSRHGRPVILNVQAKSMAAEGYKFFQSESEAGIWLTQKVPPEFIL